MSDCLVCAKTLTYRSEAPIILCQYCDTAARPLMDYGKVSPYWYDHYDGMGWYPDPEDAAGNPDPIFAALDTLKACLCPQCGQFHSTKGISQ